MKLLNYLLLLVKVVNIDYSCLHDTVEGVEAAEVGPSPSKWLRS